MHVCATDEALWQERTWQNSGKLDWFNWLYAGNMQRLQSRGAERQASTAIGPLRKTQRRIPEACQPDPDPSICCTWKCSCYRIIRLRRTVRVPAKNWVVQRASQKNARKSWLVQRHCQNTAAKECWSRAAIWWCSQYTIASTDEHALLGPEGWQWKTCSRDRNSD